MHSRPSKAEWTTSSRSSDRLPTRLAATLHAAMEVLPGDQGNRATGHPHLRG